MSSVFNHPIKRKRNWRQFNQPDYLENRSLKRLPPGCPQSGLRKWVVPQIRDDPTFQRIFTLDCCSVGEGGGGLASKTAVSCQAGALIHQGELIRLPLTPKCTGGVLLVVILVCFPARCYDSDLVFATNVSCTSATCTATC